MEPRLKLVWTDFRWADVFIYALYHSYHYLRGDNPTSETINVIALGYFMRRIGVSEASVSALLGSRTDSYMQTSIGARVIRTSVCNITAGHSMLHYHRHSLSLTTLHLRVILSTCVDIQICVAQSV